MSNSPDKLLVKELSLKEAPYRLLLMADPSEKMLSTYIDKGILYGAFINQELIGEYVLLKKDHLTAEIKNIAVESNWQGKGIGKFLLQHAANEAQQLGCKTLQIGTGNSSINQLLLYQRSGFEITSIVKNFFKDHYDTPIYENGIECKHLIVLEKAIL